MEERRRALLSEEQHRSLIDAIQEAIRFGFTATAIPQDQHRQHHEYLSTLLEDRKRRLLRNEKIRTSVLGWLVITVLGGIGTGVYQLFITAKEHWK
ncbi:MAG: hypothetical protein M0Z78_00040 [Betaproteobacteria bacterium]|nr:hypothetical protein [Betaproteobacteria bacterium]